ncbi:MAG: glycosyltransferase [Candidatus Omnitrophica bacterium]|nr:glycosyltransferase [Candidatus Omnitrophota bacterium]
MNILHVIPSLSGTTGGPARALFDLTRQLVLEGHSVTIFTTASAGGRSQNGFTIEQFQRKWPRPYCYAPDLKNRLEETLAGFDVVHIHGIWWYPTYIASRLCHQKKIPYIIRPCGMLDRYSLSRHGFKKQIYGWLIERKNLEQAGAIHFTSEEEKNRSALFGSKATAAVIPLGVFMEDYLEALPQGEFRARHSPLLGKKIILFLGRIHFKKGLDLLVRAFSSMHQQNPAVHLVIAGPDDGYLQSLKRFIRRNNIESSVTLLGYVEGRQKLALLRDSDIFCLPSRQENFGIAVIEAMAAGLPVVVSDQVNICREIDAARAGKVVPCDERALEHALKELLQCEEERKQMAERAKKVVQEQFQWKQVTQKIIQLYKSLCR